MRTGYKYKLEYNSPDTTNNTKPGIKTLLSNSRDNSSKHSRPGNKSKFSNGKPQSICNIYIKILNNGNFNNISKKI